MNRDEYHMNISIAVRKKANCLGRRVGAVIVKENRIISTGYNGTPEGMTNCLDGGCVQGKLRGGVRQIAVDDPEPDWANGKVPHPVPVAIPATKG